MTPKQNTSTDPSTGGGGPRTRSQGPPDDVPDGAAGVSRDPPQEDNNEQVEAEALNMTTEDAV